MLILTEHTCNTFTKALEMLWEDITKLQIADRKFNKVLAECGSLSINNLAMSVHLCSAHVCVRQLCMCF